MGRTRLNSAVWAYLLTIAAMGLALPALHFGVDVSLSDESGIRMSLPVRVGKWTGSTLRYCHNKHCEGSQSSFRAESQAPDDTCPHCDQALHDMTLIEQDILPKDTRFVKAVYSTADGRTLSASIVLSGRERSSIHRPQRCLVGQGFEITANRVLEVPLHEGSSVDVMVLDVLRRHGWAGTRARPEPIYYAYWFVGRNRETPYHLVRMFWLAWDRLVHDTAHRWAYVAIAGSRPYRDNHHYKEINDFIAAIHSQIVLQ